MDGWRMEMLSKKDSYGWTWAHNSAYLCEVADEVRAVLDGLNSEERTNLLSIKDHTGSTPVHIAVLFCKKGDVVRALFDTLDTDQRICLLSIKDESGYTPVHNAPSFSENAGVVFALFETLNTEQLISLLFDTDIIQRTPLTKAFEKKRGWRVVGTLLGNLDRVALTKTVRGRPLIYHVLDGNNYHDVVLRSILKNVRAQQRVDLLMTKEQAQQYILIHHIVRSVTNPEMVKVWLETLDDQQLMHILSMKDRMGNTTLHHAVLFNENAQNVIKDLLENLDVKQRTKLLCIMDNQQSTHVLQAAGAAKDVDVLKALLDKVDSEHVLKLLLMKDKNSAMLVMKAAHKSNNVTSFRVLLENLHAEHRFELLTMMAGNEQPVLHLVVKSNMSADVVRALLETLNGDKIKGLLLRKGKNEQTPIHIVARYGANPDLLCVLLETLDLENIAEVFNASDADGNTPIHIAVERRDNVGKRNACAQLEQLSGLGKSALLLKKRKDGKSPIDLGDEHFYLMWLKDSEISYKAKVEILSEHSTSGEMMIHYLRDKHPSLLTTLTPTMDKTTLVAILIASKSGDASSDLNWINVLTKGRDDLGEECISHICDYMEAKLKDGEASNRLRKLLDILCEALDCMHRVLLWEDTYSNTLLHLAAMINHKEFIKKVLMTQRRDEYHSALLSMNKEGKSPYYLTKNREVQKLLAWTETQKGCYPLVSPPRIVIFYSDVERPGYKEEMDSLVDILPAFNVKFTTVRNPTKEQLFTQIREHQKDEVSALMVVIMCHGYSGVVQLHDGDLPIRAVLDQMNPMNLKGIPKILVLQACQGSSQSRYKDSTLVTCKDAAVPEVCGYASNLSQRKEYNTRSVDAEIKPRSGSSAAANERRGFEERRVIDKPYIIRAPDMMVLAATVDKQTATRNFMIPLLARNLMESEADDDLYDVFRTTNQQVRESEPAQVPIFQSTMTGKVCMKNIFRVDHNYASKAPQKSCTIS